MKYIAHFKQDTKEDQELKNHLLQTAKSCGELGEKLGLYACCYLAGLLHDMGKYSDKFQSYIRLAKESPDKAVRGSVDHSTAGGRLLYKMLHHVEKGKISVLIAEVIGNVIISHHAYLQDFLNSQLESPYLNRVRDKDAEELRNFDELEARFFQEVISEEEFLSYVEQAILELERYIEKATSMKLPMKMMFLSKFLFSVLIDADRTDARSFEMGKKAIKPEVEKLFEDYYKKLMLKIDSFERQRQMNQNRAALSDQCEAFGYRPSGIYSLSIPTGGGKTLASFRYALKHSLEYGKKRIIYIAPYTTILEQNSKVIRDIFKDERHILEFHSNVVNHVSDGKDALDNEWSEMVSETWDSPIILTTMVQFLNNFYDKKSKSIRRLHRLTDAVIIFDEVQKVPTHCVSLFNEALNFLNVYGNSSLILCTATQPALSIVKHRLEMDSKAEMVEDLSKVFQSFKRVELVYKGDLEHEVIPKFDTPKLAEFVKDKMDQFQNMLVILNTRTVVKRLYEHLNAMKLSIPIYHLSTTMCAAHRQDVLMKVKDHLENEERVICISTQLIEAGVDISFDSAIRSLAGLDSIAQAAGRCNRHGESDMRKVYVVDHLEEKLGNLKEIKEGKEIARSIFTDLAKNKDAYGGDPLSQKAMQRYFEEFYQKFELILNYPVKDVNKDMINLLAISQQNSEYARGYYKSNGVPIPLKLVNSYQTAANFFEVISNLTVSAIAPYGDKGNDIIAELAGSKSIESWDEFFKKVQPFLVNLYKYEEDVLSREGALKSYREGILVLKESSYDKESGLDVKNDSGFEFAMM